MQGTKESQNLSHSVIAAFGYSLTSSHYLPDQSKVFSVFKSLIALFGPLALLREFA